MYANFAHSLLKSNNLDWNYLLIIGNEKVLFKVLVRLRCRE